MLISLIHPSYGRPEKALATAQNWIRNAGVPVEHIFSLDSGDPMVNYYVNADSTIINNNDCVVQAVNQAAFKAKGDILIYLSDDFDCFEGWAVEIIRIASQYTGEYMIKVSDGLQEFSNQVLTIPIMSRQLYQRLGYFFYPEYKSMWVDVDLYYVCHRMGVIMPHKEILFQHNHYCNGRSKRDDTYNRSDAHFNSGKIIYQRRMRQGFP